jgi:hypothetical protein
MLLIRPIVSTTRSGYKYRTEVILTSYISMEIKGFITILAVTYTSSILITSLSSTDSKIYARDVITGDYKRIKAILVEAKANPSC